MLSEGVEPSRHRHWFLKPACLPFHQESEIYNFERKKKIPRTGFEPVFSP